MSKYDDFKNYILTLSISIFVVIENFNFEESKGYKYDEKKDNFTSNNFNFTLNLYIIKRNSTYYKIICMLRFAIVNPFKLPLKK